MIGEFVGIGFVVFISLIMPLWLLLHYITRWKQTRGLSQDDEKMLEDLWESASRMEDRIQALEEILDKDTQEWRRKEQ